MSGSLRVRMRVKGRQAEVDASASFIRQETSDLLVLEFAVISSTQEMNKSQYIISCKRVLIDSTSIDVGEKPHAEYG